MPGMLGAKERWVATGSVAALLVGMVVGEVLHKNGAQGVVGAFSVAGDLMLVRPLMMLVLPLIFTSVVAGITSLGDPSRLGKLGLATSAYFLGSMLVAATLGASRFQPAVSHMTYGIGSRSHTTSQSVCITV